MNTMLRITISLAICLTITLVPSTSQAGSLSETLPYLTLAGGHAADWLSSRHFSAEAEQRRLLTGERGCSEGNVRYRAMDGSMNRSKALREKMLLVGATLLLGPLEPRHISVRLIRKV